MKKRVRIHFVDMDPSLEGFLFTWFWRHRRWLEVAVPQVLAAPEAPPVVLDEARKVLVPREKVWFIEEIRAQ